MNNEWVTAILEECKLALSLGPSEPSRESRQEYEDCQASLPADLRTLLEEAKEMKWPFVPERWQYKQAVGPEDKTNLKDTIGGRLQELLVYLKASIRVADFASAAAIVFLIDRFLYWVDGSRKLLQIAKALHRLSPSTPIAPQVVIRQARVSVNSGKLQKAEYILSSLINNSGATGGWVYHLESDKVLVQAVSVQIRGQILQKLGMWYEAAELTSASLVGFNALPIPDKKGIGSSLGILAYILVSMNDDDFQRFRKNCSINLLVCGSCLLSFSLSSACPPEDKLTYLNEAKEAFTVGLLTRRGEEVVTSKHELHCFIKAIFCLTVTHKWLGEAQMVVEEAENMCKEAMRKFYVYIKAESKEKENLAQEILVLVSRVKSLLQVTDFPNSDANSFVPDSYKSSLEEPVVLSQISFDEIIESYSQYHTTICEAFETSCRESKEQRQTVAEACITAMKTDTKDVDTEWFTESHHSSSSPESGDGLSRAEKRRREFARKARPMHSSESDDRKTSLNDSQSSGSSWFRLSESDVSSGWEEIADCPEEPERNQAADFDTQCSTYYDEMSEGNLPQNVDRNSQEMQKPSLQETKMDLSPLPPSAKGPSISSEYGDSLTTVSVHKEEKGGPSDTQNFKDSGEHSLSQTRKQKESTNKEEMGSPSKIQNMEETRESPPGQTKNESESLKGLHSPTHVLFDTIDTQAETIDDTDDFLMAAGQNSSRIPDVNQAEDELGQGSKLKESEGSPPDTSVQNVTRHSENEDGAGESRPPAPADDNFCDQETEEGDEKDDYLSQILNSSHSSISSLKSSFGASFFSSGSFSEVDSPSFLNSSTDSFVFVQGQKEMEILEKRTLKPEDYTQLLSGVSHTWLLERFQDTGVFKPKRLREVYSALLLKCSKTSASPGVWTAQETQVYIGAPLGRKGKQRSAFWIQFLHQEEMLGRYIGKEYQSSRELYYHLNDVERQMTAQYYVREFNKRLYEKQIPTQIYFVPAEVLLIVEDNVIKGCVSVEPYILGEFVKLTNNRKAVVREYKATEYGLAFGHFTYEFSRHKEVVVDLQGWITGNGKGLLYLTDPQIHSICWPKPSSSGRHGIDCFLKYQHGPECNEICKMLSLKQVSCWSPPCQAFLMGRLFKGLTEHNVEMPRKRNLR
ncbi:ALPK1 kinase, partial [Polypterus senegalus]